MLHSKSDSLPYNITLNYRGYFIYAKPDNKSSEIIIRQWYRGMFFSVKIGIIDETIKFMEIL